VKEFVDGWDNAFAFYRWGTTPWIYLNPPGQTTAPTVNTSFIVELDGYMPSGANAVFRDPLDPTGTLMDPSWNNAANNTPTGGVYWFELLLHPVHNPSAAQWTPMSWFTMPTVVSAGKNGVLGDTDDLLSFRLRMGARGD
jgi:hypothetical protein